MWLSTKYSSVEMEGRSVKVNVLLPRMAKMADWSREKEMVQRIQDKIWLYWMLWDTASKLARRLLKIVAFLPSRTTDSTFRTRSPYSCFFLKFMSTEQRSYLSPAIAKCIGMKHPNIKCTEHVNSALKQWMSNWVFKVVALSDGFYIILMDDGIENSFDWRIIKDLKGALICLDAEN